jgi:hypothetical protein
VSRVSPDNPAVRFAGRFVESGWLGRQAAHRYLQWAAPGSPVRGMSRQQRSAAAVSQARRIAAQNPVRLTLEPPRQRSARPRTRTRATR